MGSEDRVVKASVLCLLGDFGYLPVQQGLQENGDSVNGGAVLGYE